MTELFELTILDQVRLLTPYFIYGGIVFFLLVINTIVMRCVLLRRWHREEEERLPETVKRKLADRDKMIRSQRYHLEKKDGVIERFSVATRAANMHCHKVSEILQMPLLNEVARRRKRA